MPGPPNDPNALRHTRAMPPFCPRTIARHALVAAVFNTVLALAITVSGDQSFAANLLYSQLIGMTIWALIDGGRFLLSGDGWPGAPKMAGVVLVGVLTGYFGGSALADLLLGREPLQGFSRFPKAMTGFLLMSLAAGVAGAYFFTTRAMLASARLANEEALRQASEAKLKLLETQLEPHMLFNTLANLRALIGIDPPRAQVMLDHMNRYLRATLSGSRATTHPLAAEFARLDDYLALMVVRMGTRLGCTLELPEALRDMPVPPLLLQPLVENAIRHGLEPKVDGGHITVRAASEHGELLLEVADTGVGFDMSVPPPNTADSSFGLAQVRERVATAYGGRGRVELKSTPGSGTVIRIHLPLATLNP